MITINGDWFLVLLAFAFVVGVSMWIGYLLGRVRTLDPQGERLGRGVDEAPGPPIVVGTAAGLIGLWVLGPVIAHPTLPVDAGGFLFMATGLALVGLGVYFVVRGVRLATRATR